MAIFHRKLLEEHETAVKSTCTPPCHDPHYGDDPPPLPSFHVDVDQPGSHPSRSVSLVFVLMFCALAVAFSVVFCLTLTKRRRESTLRNSLRRNGGDDGTVTHQEFLDEDRGPSDGVFHPIWLINRVGLDQSVIDSINVVKYRKDEGLIEGTDCSVCLTEFEDDESLRLLPKCNHAFHVPCIDACLRSYKNCPLCRAPIVKEANSAEVSTDESNSNELSSIREDNLIENSESGDHRGAGEIGHGEMRGTELATVGGGKTAEVLGRNSPNLNAGGNGGIRVLSDLGDHRAKRGAELEAIRRSFSMDLSLPIMEHEGGSDTRFVVESNKSNLQKVAKGHKRSSSNMYKRVMKSSSFGFSSQKGPISMKRSYSSTGKSSSEPRHGKSQDSILPL